MSDRSELDGSTQTCTAEEIRHLRLSLHGFRTGLLPSTDYPPVPPAGADGATCGAFIAELQRLFEDRGVIASFEASRAPVD